MNYRTLFQKLFRQDFGGGVTLWPYLAAISLAFAWLQPHHYHPWPAFHANALAAGWMLVGAAALVAAGVRPKHWSELAFVMLLLAVGVAAQWSLGIIAHGSDAAMSGLQLLGCALILIFVREICQRFGVERLGDVVFSAIVVAGVLSVAGALYQTLRIESQDQFSGLGVWIMSIPDGARAAGNVAQPNEMATLLVWAIIGGLWALYRGAIRWPVYIVLSCYLAIGLGLSQSRIGLVEMIALVVSLAFWRRHVGGWKASVAVAAAFLTQLSVFFALPLLANLLGLEYDGRTLSHLANHAARLDIYEHVMLAISMRPWLGYGMTTLAQVQWATAETLPGLHSYFLTSHNIVLDIFAWWGLPLGSVLLLFLAWWLWRAARTVKTMSQVVFGCALLVFMLHAMVELPHWSAAYLFPAAVFAGVLDSSLQSKWSLTARFYMNQLVLAFVGISLMLIIFDYYRLEQSYNDLRAEERRLIKVDDVPHAFVLTHLADYLRMSRMSARPNVPNETIVWMEKTITGVPNYSTQLTHAVTLALNGRKAEAQVWMRRLNAVSPRHYHAEYLRVWANFQRWHPELVGDMQWPPLNEPQ